MRVKGMYMEILVTMGNRLRELRKEKKMRQEDMATLMEITVNHYQKVEYGKINLPVLTLCGLADYFGVTTDYLLGRSDERD